ncbi:MAG: protein-glutamate O-methyltransferase CheR [Elusimicrobia bacterium]|nr:protein-glutamate O-methyltransferase CheR [Elusimicrobiota bacterium]
MPSAVQETNSEQVTYLANMARRLAGFELEKERSLISDPRVLDLLVREKAGSVEELVARLMRLPEGPLHHAVVESLAVSDTSFFRDTPVFEFIEKIILPDLIKNRSHTHQLTLWSAGCSTGQESYSLAMSTTEALESSQEWTWQVLGTDLSTRNIRVAESGSYSQFDINCGLPARRLVTYFEKRENHWCVQDKIKNRIQFKKMNLVTSENEFPQVDLILFRNVLRYFDSSHQTTVLKRLHAALRPDGYLVMGQDETASKESGFEPIHSGKFTVFRPLQ